MDKNMSDFTIKSVNNQNQCWENFQNNKKAQLKRKIKYSFYLNNLVQKLTLLSSKFST